MKSFYILWKILGKTHKLFFCFVVFLMLIQAILEVLSIALIIPFITLILNPFQATNLFILDHINFLLQGFERESLLPICALIFFLIFIIKNISLVLIYKIIYNYTGSVRTKISTDLLSKYLKQNYEYFVKNSFSKIQANLTGEVNALLNSFFIPVQIIISEIVIIIFVIFLLILTNNLAGIFVVVPTFVVVGIIIKFLNKKIKTLGNYRLINNRDNAKLTHYILLGIRDILLIGKTKEVLKYFKKIQSNIANVEVNLNVLKVLPKNLIEIFGLFTFLILIIYFFNQGKENDQIITTLTFYFVIAYRILPSINKIFLNYQLVKFSKNSVLIIGNDLSLSDKIKISDNKKLIYRIKNKIDLKDINFEYVKSKKILNQINLTLKKNEIIGIKGESGSGKTSLLNVISRLSLPTSGKILIDNKILKSKKDTRSYQNIISLISQDTFLIEGSIKENILLGSDDKYDSKKFYKSITLSKVDEFLKILPNGIDTLIDSNSKSISSGQKQRIAIARQIYSDRQVLIFDEATNALDENNENEVLNNIRTLKDNKIIILVSHNPKNLKICDKIFFLKNGRLFKI